MVTYRATFPTLNRRSIAELQAEQDREESELGSAPRGGSWQRVENDKRRGERAGRAGGARQRQRGIGNYAADRPTTLLWLSFFFLFLRTRGLLSFGCPGF